MSTTTVRRVVITTATVFMLLLLIVEFRHGCRVDLQVPSPPTPSASATDAGPAPQVYEASAPMESVVEVSKVSGSWAGVLGEWAVISPRRSGSPYPWSLKLKLHGADEPLDCGFFSNQYLNDPREPRSGYWRVSYCEGADLPDGGGRYAMRLVLMLEPGSPERLHVLVGSMYASVLHREERDAGTDQ